MTATGFHHVELVMGMAVSIDVRDDVAGTPGLDDVLLWLHHVDRTFSPYKDGARSPVSVAASSPSTNSTRKSATCCCSARTSGC
ncbi:MAG: hypothetical protein R2715_13115 [Ilumatobacteraceae bacterium]